MWRWFFFTLLSSLPWWRSVLQTEILVIIIYVFIHIWFLVCCVALVLLHFVIQNFVCLIAWYCSRRKYTWNDPALPPDTWLEEHLVKQLLTPDCCLCSSSSRNYGRSSELKREGPRECAFFSAEMTLAIPNVVSFILLHAIVLLFLCSWSHLQGNCVHRTVRWTL